MSSYRELVSECTYLSTYVFISAIKYVQEVNYMYIPWCTVATGLLTLLESITAIPDWKVTKMGRSSIFWPFFLLSFCVHQASMITAEANITIQMWKMLKSQSIALTKELTLVGDSQVTLCLPLYNIWLENHIIHRNYAPHAWKLNWACMCLDTVSREIFTLKIICVKNFLCW